MDSEGLAWEEATEHTYKAMEWNGEVVMDVANSLPLQ